MKYLEIVEQGRVLLDAVDNNDTGVMTATLSVDGKINVAAHASEQFSVAIIQLLTEQILNQNMCCTAHLMQTAMALHEVLTNVVSKKLDEVTENPDSETKH
jgi:hypothetical protein